MSNIYIINNTSGEALFAIQPKATNGPGSAGHNTDLTLYGYGAPNWGERFNENFYRLLENFACAEKEPGDVGYNALSPSPKSEGDVDITEKYGVNKPVLGQTWFNTTKDKLFICTQTDPTVVWSQVTSDDTGSAYVVRTGDTMTGFLTLHSDPVENMHAATKQYVDTGIASVATLFVRKSGDTMNTGQTLVLGRDPVGDMDAVTKQYVDAIAGTPGPINDPVKIGTVVPFAGTEVPPNWLLCDGRAVSRVTYSQLHGVIRETYGPGDGSTTFNLPDFRGRMPIGLDNMGGTSANVVTNTNADTIGGKVGAEFHTLTLNEMPSHTHTGTTAQAGDHTHTGSTTVAGIHAHNMLNNMYIGQGYNLGGGGGAAYGTTTTTSNGDHSHTLSISNSGDHSHTITINSAGSSAAHNNVQPSLTMNYIIKATPEPTTIGGPSGDYVARGGDSMYGSLTMTGATDITLARAPTMPMHAVNKQYVDSCCSGSSSSEGEPSWTYRSTITAVTSLTSTTTFTNCGSVTFTVPNTTTRKGIVIAHVPIDVIGYPYQVFIRMLLDGVHVDSDSFNINPSSAGAREGHSLTLTYTGDIAPGSHTITFQGKITTGQALDSGFSVKVNGAHSGANGTDIDTYTRIDVLIPGSGGGLAGTGTSGAMVDPVKIGTLTPFAGTNAPTNWLLCNGQAVSRTTYSELFSAISTTYGSGDGSTTFNVPDLRGRAAIGLDNMGGTSANVVTNTNADLLGGKFGSETHTLTTNEMPSHHHTGYFPAQPGTQIQSGSGWGNNFLNTTDVGGGQSHNNMPPSMALNWIIKAKSGGTAVGDLSNYYTKTESDARYAPIGTVSQTPWIYRNTNLTQVFHVGGGLTTTITVPGTGTRQIMIEAIIPLEINLITTEISVSLYLDSVVVDTDYVQFGISNPTVPGDPNHVNRVSAHLAYVGNITAGAHTFQVRGTGAASSYPGRINILVV